MPLWFSENTSVQFSGLSCHFLMPNSSISKPQIPNLCNGDKGIQAYLGDRVSSVPDQNNKATIAIK